MLSKKTKRLHGIDSKSWEHPADKAALTALKQLKGFDELVKFLVSVTTERSLHLMHLSSSIKVGKSQFPQVNAIYEDVLDVFGIEKRPDLFIVQSPFYNAHTFGVKDPYIVLNSAAVNTFETDELRFIIAHELGHVLSGHVLYKTLLWLLTSISLEFFPIPSILILPILAALYEWDRKSELSADRAGLLGTQLEEPSYQVLIRMAGGDDPKEVNINDFFLQVQEYNEQQGALNTVHKFLNTVWLSHPQPVLRLQDLKTWHCSGSYSSIINGEYLRTQDTKPGSTAEDIKDGFHYYSSNMQNDKNSILETASKVGDTIFKTVDDAGKNLKDFLNNFFVDNN